MRGASDCARRLKKVIRALRARHGDLPAPSPGDPLAQLILGIFTRDMPEARAHDVIERIRSMVVDYNELRVTSPRELAEYVGEYPDAWTKCEDMSRALNRIFAIRHDVALDWMNSASKKEVREFLARIDGLEPYTRARLRLLGLRHHAFPLDEAMWAWARQQRIVDEKCTLDEAQAFLERQIPDKEALEVYLLIRKQAWIDVGTAVRKHDVERIRSVPPNRSSRNMLRPMRPDGSTDTDEPPEADLPEELETPDAGARAAARKGSRTPAKAQGEPRRVRVPKPTGGVAERVAAKPRPNRGKRAKTA
ncbi:MAG: hypothetical protein CHACPFDD_03387 [Phycisphaerae bacterium]|nr:hypothetical protein [Phycisphaerae bacterium]